MEYTKEELFQLADIIGAKIAAGQLPPKDENGFYQYYPVTLPEK
jgi:hypothetical protein